jgi:hypothetical protein
MAATVHHLPTSTNVPPPADMTDAELRAWWKGFGAGYQERDAEYEAIDAATLDRIGAALAKHSGCRNSRPVLTAVK